VSTAVLLIAALALDAWAGEPRWLWSRVPHPAVIMGKAIGRLDAAWNTPGATRLKGALAVGLLVITAGLLGWGVSLLGPVASVLGAAILLAQRSLVQHVRAVGDGLRQSNDAGRTAVAMIVSRDVSQSSASDTARAAIESLSENFSDGVIAPAFWFLIAGLPGIVIYKTVNTADSMIGYLTPRYAAFGWAAAQHRSPNAGWPEAAMARALSIALAGPRSYHGTPQDLAWVNGSGRRVLGATDIDDAIAIVWKAWALAMLGIAVIGGGLWLF
jgi:adenosylcobinamide-phosphate synthase